jgi:uncharacterized membrane protein YheB (UPF0754 family)
MLLIPVLGALIGWSTNWLAIRMLFRPRHLYRLGPIRLQGVIPRRQHELAELLGGVIERELFSHQDLRQALNDSDFVRDCERSIFRHVYQFTELKLQQAPSFLRKMLTDGGPAGRFEQALTDEISHRLPEILEEASSALENNADIQSIVTEKIANFEVMRMEGIIMQVARRELTVIELAGATLGFLIGLVQVALISIF